MAEINKSDAEWRRELTEEQYRILREKGTETPFSGKYYHNENTGTYLCAACGNELFNSQDKFDSGSGWPSFTQPVKNTNILEKTDISHHMNRVEIQCGRCQSHLGHVFADGPQPTGLRYCINSVALKFKEK